MSFASFFRTCPGKYTSFDVLRVKIAKCVSAFVFRRGFLCFCFPPRGFVRSAINSIIVTLIIWYVCVGTFCRFFAFNSDFYYYGLRDVSSNLQQY